MLMATHQSGRATTAYGRRTRSNRRSPQAGYPHPVTKELSPLTRSEDDRRELIFWAVACAKRLCRYSRRLPAVTGGLRDPDGRDGLRQGRATHRCCPLVRGRLPFHRPRGEHAHSHCGGPGRVASGRDRPHGGTRQGCPRHTFSRRWLGPFREPGGAEGRGSMAASPLAAGLRRIRRPTG